MALAVLATANLGQAVQERIKIQNTADSAAYSLAAMEARTFNYIAFLNRAQIAHYNTAMVIQSYITWAGYQVAQFAVTMEQIINLYKNYKDVREALCPNVYYEAVCQALKTGELVILWPLSKVAAVLITLATSAHQAAGMVGHNLVEAMQIFNKEVIWKAQLWRAAMMNMPLLSGAEALIELNDPDIHKADARTMLSMAFNIGLNSWEYYQAFDKGAGVNPMLFSLLFDWKRVTGKTGAFSAAKVQKVWEDGKQDHDEWRTVEAYQVMAELCNATRFPKFVYNRAGKFKSKWVFAQLRSQKLGQTRFVSQIAKTAKSARIDALVLDSGAPALLDLSDIKADHLVDRAQERLWEEADDKLSETAADRVVARLTGKPPKQLDPALEGEAHNHAPGFSLASADVTTSGSGGGVFAFVGSKWKGDDKLGDAILAHHENGVHYGYDAGKISKLFDQATGSLTEGLTDSDMLGGLQSTADGMLDEVSDLAALGGEFSDLVKDPLGAVTGSGSEGGEGSSTDDAEGLLDTLTGLGDKVKGWFGGAKEQAADMLVSKMKDIAQPIIDKVTTMAKDMAGKALGKLGLDAIYDSAGNSTFMATLKQVQKLLAFFKRAKKKNMKNHAHVNWPGFAPYFKFNASSDRTRDFNQPSTWIWVSKSHEAFQGKLNASEKTRSPWRFKFSWTSGWDTAELDTTARGIKWPMLGEGFNAMARGMAYYHRPGNWHEHPNFFNPFWRARLAPIGQKLQSFWERFVGGQLSDGGDSMIAQKVLSGLQNAQMDLFTTFVSSIITH